MLIWAFLMTFVLVPSQLQAILQCNIRKFLRSNLKDRSYALNIHSDRKSGNQKILAISFNSLWIEPVEPSRSCWSRDFTLWHHFRRQTLCWPEIWFLNEIDRRSDMLTLIVSFWDYLSKFTVDESSEYIEMRGLWWSPFCSRYGIWSWYIKKSVLRRWSKVVGFHAISDQSTFRTSTPDQLVRTQFLFTRPAVGCEMSNWCGAGKIHHHEHDISW